MIRFVANLVMFQATWLASVAGAGLGHWWWGPAAFGLFALVHFRLSHCPRADLLLLAVALALGLAVDSALIQAGVLVYATPVPFSSLAPVWILALWLAFALTLNHSLASLRTRPLLAVLLGLVGGPLAYGIAIKIWKAGTFMTADWIAYLAIGVAWALITPFLLNLGERFRLQSQGPARVG